MPLNLSTLHNLAKKLFLANASSSNESFSWCNWMSIVLLSAYKSTSLWSIKTSDSLCTICDPQSIQLKLEVTNHLQEMFKHLLLDRSAEIKMSRMRQLAPGIIQLDRIMNQLLLIEIDMAFHPVTCFELPLHHEDGYVKGWCSFNNKLLQALIGR